MFTQLVALVFLLLAIFGVHLVTLMYGWGLEPQSWTWILGGFVLNLVLMGMMRGIKAETKT